MIHEQEFPVRLNRAACAERGADLDVAASGAFCFSSTANIFGAQAPIQSTQEGGVSAVFQWTGTPDS